MITKSIIAAAIVATSQLVMSQTTAAAQTAPVSSLSWPAQNTCVDVSTTNPSEYFLDIYGHSCDGAASQEFAFQPVSGAPANTYELVSQSSGQCLIKYRTSIRLGSCDPAPEWTFQPVGSAANTYQMVVTSSLSNPTPACMQVSPAPSGYPGPTFADEFCDSSNSAQLVTLSAAL